MGIKIEELMRKNVVYLTPAQPLEHIKKIFEKNKISALPVIDSDEHVIGIISHKDLIKFTNPELRASDMMTQNVYTIPEYEKVEVAARIMRNHKIHHLVVTKDKKLMGIISSFDLLKLVENHRYVAKNNSAARNPTGKRNKAEMASA